MKEKNKHNICYLFVLIIHMKKLYKGLSTFMIADYNNLYDKYTQRFNLEFLFNIYIFRVQLQKYFMYICHIA